jgi:hypothetical protein
VALALLLASLRSGQADSGSGTSETTNLYFLPINRMRETVLHNMEINGISIAYRVRLGLSVTSTMA